MKFTVPEISWHNRDPVLSVDFQPKAEENGPLRLATGGTDSHVLIWYISTIETGTVNLEVAADLTRHQKAVNVVRWSPNGQLLASGDDESIIFVWKQKFEKDTVWNVEQTEEQYKEIWVIHKTLRGHMEDVLDISWSPDSLHLASGSVDNKLLIWDIVKGKYTCILNDHKGFVQGVSWDPKGQLIGTASSDRMFRTFDISTKKVTSRSSKAILPFPATHPLHGKPARLYYDDTLQTYYRRLHFSPDGLLLAVPAGRVEPDQHKDWKPINAVYIYTRYSLKVPAVVLPCGEPALSVRWSPHSYRPRATGPAPALATPRMLLAVATRRSLLVYDTQQRAPLAFISNIHYTRLTDLSWSPDGRALVASSTDGFCSIVSFADGELGDILPDPIPEPMEVQTDEQSPNVHKSEANTETTPPQKKQDTKSKDAKPTPTMDAFIKFKAPEKSPKNKTQAQQKTLVKIDVLEEVAMPSWSDNSSNEIIQPKETDTKHMEMNKSDIVVIEDSEDIKLVYEDSVNPTSPMGTSVESSSASENTFMKTAFVMDVKAQAPTTVVPSPKAPRRVNLITLSSPKNKKKL